MVVKIYLGEDVSGGCPLQLHLKYAVIKFDLPLEVYSKRTSGSGGHPALH